MQTNTHNQTSHSEPRAVYDPVSRVFHWLTAIIVVTAFILGPEGFGRMIDQGVDPATRIDIVIHETLGVTIFVLTVLRLLWVAVRPKAPYIDMPTWMHHLSKLVMVLIWVLLLLLPMTAILALGSEAHPLTLLGGFRIDQMPWIANLPIAEAADWGEVHGLLGDTIMVLAGAHSVAAIFHYVILKDGVLSSMLPILKPLKSKR